MRRLRRIFTAGLILAFAVPAAPQSRPVVGLPLQITVCSVSHDDKDAGAKLDLLKSLGVTSIQTYVFWNKVEKAPGVLDWSEYDADVALFKAHGLKWVPFVIAGPWYVTPDFVRTDPGMTMFRCLEHGRDSAVPSLWSPRLREYVRAYLGAFAAHFRPAGVLESVNLGISGDYGEAIYPVLGNWPGEYHSHPGYWCGDALSAADFRAAMSALYGDDISALNRAWKSGFASFAEIAPFLPDRAPSERAFQEFLRWYRGAMTDWSDFWMAAAREAFPGEDIYLCTGGDMAPEHGSDFSAQAKVAAARGGFLRITNEASSFPMNVRLTRLVGSACRFYGAGFGHEPAATVTPVGTLGRLFNAVTSGARQLFLYNTPELMGEAGGVPAAGRGGEFLRDYASFRRTAEPVIDVALYHPLPTSRQTGANRQDWSELAANLRRFVDCDFLDDRMIGDGALAGKSVLILAGAGIMDAPVVATIRAWVEQGGTLFVLDCRPPDWDGSTAGFDGLAGFTPETDEIRGITEMTVERPGVLPSIASLQGLFLTRAFTGLASDIRPLLAMRYAPQGKGAWRRAIGRGTVFAYYGPMDMRQEEQSWIEAQNLPLRFLKDGIRAAVAGGILKREPASLNLSTPDLYFVETTDGLWALNMGNEARRVGAPKGEIEVPAASIRRIR
ncbi:MAG: hypothetical protein NTZ26_05395 [Candidatus Aminicenantes bacterium]|nr:hypothetical protein [Candidatus Aminicenantes bacterium]